MIVACLGPAPHGQQNRSLQERRDQSEQLWKVTGHFSAVRARSGLAGTVSVRKVFAALLADQICFV